MHEMYNKEKPLWDQIVEKRTGVLLISKLRIKWISYICIKLQSLLLPSSQDAPLGEGKVWVSHIPLTFGLSIPYPDNYSCKN